MDWVIRSEISCKYIMNKETINEIISLYSVPNMSLTKVAKHFRTTPQKIKKVLIENNIPIKKLSEMYTKSFDKTFFDIIDTEEKAYWLGFICADGYVTKSVFGIKIKDTDGDHLIKLKNALKSDHKIGHYHVTNGYSQNTWVNALSIDNQYFTDSLIRHGVVYNKSATLQFPSNDIVPDELIHHFIRGYFDGNGSVYFTSPYRYICISIEGPPSFLNYVLKIFSKVSGSSAKLYDSKGPVKSLKIGGSRQVKSIYEYMYNDATIFLGRKKNRFDSYFK